MKTKNKNNRVAYIEQLQPSMYKIYVTREYKSPQAASQASKNTFRQCGYRRLVDANFSHYLQGQYFTTRKQAEYFLSEY